MEENEILEAVLSVSGSYCLSVRSLNAQLSRRGPTKGGATLQSRKHTDL